MDSLFHFIFPVIAALAARVHTKHLFRSIFFAGLITLLIDIDHFIGFSFDRALFHNVFVTILIPVFLLFLSFEFKTSKYTKGFFVLLLIFLSSHLFLDLFTEGAGIAILFPFSTTRYFIEFCLSVPIVGEFASEACVISSYGISLFLFFIIILMPCYYIDKIIEHVGRAHRKIRR